MKSRDLSRFCEYQSTSSDSRRETSWKFSRTLCNILHINLLTVILQKYECYRLTCTPVHSEMTQGARGGEPGNFSALFYTLFQVRLHWPYLRSHYQVPHDIAVACQHNDRSYLLFASSSTPSLTRYYLVDKPHTPFEARTHKPRRLGKIANNAFPPPRSSSSIAHESTVTL